MSDLILLGFMYLLVLFVSFVFISVRREGQDDE
jgi:hypothetical protein